VLIYLWKIGDVKVNEHLVMGDISQAKSIFCSKYVPCRNLQWIP
jgi:hypothetical protein